MKNIITIPKYEKIDGKFHVVANTEYTITYTLYSKYHLNIFVNGVPVKRKLSLSHYSNSFRIVLAKAISEYNHLEDKSVKQHLFLKNYLCDDKTKNVIINYLLPINKFTNRDFLTKYGLF